MLAGSGIFMIILVIVRYMPVEKWNYQVKISACKKLKKKKNQSNFGKSSSRTWAL